MHKERADHVAGACTELLIGDQLTRRAILPLGETPHPHAPATDPTLSIFFFGQDEQLTTSKLIDPHAPLR